MIDIIMPTYNASNFIIETLSRLEKQTFKKFRLIIINDGSLDETQKLIEEYILLSKIDIKLINQRNLGEGKARNTGLKYSDKKYILFLDCDDYLAEDALEKFYRAINFYKSSVVISEYCNINRRGKILKKYKLIEEEILDKSLILKKTLTKQLWIGIGNTLIDSEIIKKNNLFFEDYTYAEDFNFFCKLAMYIDKIVTIPKILFYYVQNESSLMHQKFSYSRLEGMEAIKNIEEHYIKNLGNKYEKEFSYAYNKELMGVYTTFIRSSENEFKIEKILKMVRKIKLLDLIKIKERDKYKVFLFLFSPIFYKYTYRTFIFFKNKIYK